MERIIGGCIRLGHGTDGLSYAMLDDYDAIGVGVDDESALIALLHADSGTVARALLRASDNSYADGVAAGLAAREEVG